MPALRLETTVAISDDRRKALLASLSKIMADAIGKPEGKLLSWTSAASGD